MNRVVITGVGAVCPIGTGWEEIQTGISNGMHGTAELSIFDTAEFPTRLAAEARSQGQVVMGPRGEDRKVRFLNTALAQLSKQCDLKRHRPADKILSLGTGIDHFDLPGHVDDPSTDPLRWRNYNKHSHRIAEQHAFELGIAGGTSVNVAACVASTQAMGQAYRMIRQGLATQAITGGYDSMLSHLHYMGFFKLGALSSWTGKPSEACRPFSRDRQGIVLGEGAAVFSLERSELADPTTIFAEVAGYGCSMDAYLVTDPEPSAKHLAQAALHALAEAGLSPRDIDCVHLHGTGTFKNDLAETAAMQLVFGDRASQIPVFSLKGQIGHLIGACGAVEMLGVLYSLQHNEVPVTVNSIVPDPDVNLLVARDRPIRLPIRNILKLNAAFGGQNTAFVIRKYSPDQTL